MIVDPDFLDHWRTRMLVAALGGDELAPLYVLRIWAHCQTRRATRFRLPAAGLASLCHYDGDAQNLEKSLELAGHIRRRGEFVQILKWAKHNASLIAAWENGRKGGRPKKDTATPPEKPKRNPGVPKRKPMGNPSETDKRGLDKRREEKNTKGDESPLTPSCPEPAEPASGPHAGGPPQAPDPVALTFPVSGGGDGTWPLTKSKLAEYAESFPGIDVRAECRKALQWCRDNPGKRKTPRGMAAFLARWLGRAQDRGPPPAVNGHRGASAPRFTARGEAQDLYAARLAATMHDTPEGVL